MDGLIKKLPQLYTCCCGCSLDTGVKVIGWFCAIMHGIALLGTIIEAAFSLVTLHIVGLIFYLIWGLIELVSLALAWYLLQGVYKNITGNVKLWLQVELILWVIDVICLVISILLLIFTTGVPVGQIVSSFVRIIITMYFLSVVKSYYYDKIGLTSA